jgi:hypothetical protein
LGVARAVEVVVICTGTESDFDVVDIVLGVTNNDRFGRLNSTVTGWAHIIIGS